MSDDQERNRDLESRDRESMSRRLGRLEDTVYRHEHILCGNGKPSLEDKIMGKVEAITEHGKRNQKQTEIDLETLIAKETADREAQHKENAAIAKDQQKTLNRLERFCYCAGAVFMVLKFFGIENIAKMLH